MCGGGTNYNVAAPITPSYGEGMADAMKAQMEQLLGQGDYADIYAEAGFEGGDLGDIIQGVEAPIRKQTAQIDTDVLRQTLLGNRTESSTNGTYDDQGRLVVGYEGGQKATTKSVKTDIEFIKQSGKTNASGDPIYKVTFKDPKTGDTVKEGFSSFGSSDPFAEKLRTQPGGFFDRIRDGVMATGEPVSIGLFSEISQAEKGSFSGLDLDATRLNSNFGGDGGQILDLSDGGKLKTTIPPADATPVYGKDPNGQIIVDKSKAGQTETISASFSGDGMINLLGDSRNAIDPATGLPTTRKAGFDAQGNFLGLSAYTEDIQRGNLSRQREADLSDVERLSDRYRNVMDEYKPATTTGLDDARVLLEQQRENLTGLRKATQADVDAGNASAVDEMIQTGSGGPVSIPTADTFGGNVGGEGGPATMTAAQVGAAPTLDADTSFTAAQVADPLQLTANTQFSGELATGAGNQDTLRSQLLGDAKTALGAGLTGREQAQIADAARARSTLMGRTFDQSGAIAEAEARVQEDNNRRMQNRSFAQSVLGQDAGLQQGDITRGMAQESEQAGLNQRKALADAQMLQQSRAMGLEAGMQQDSQQAQLDQAKLLAQAQMDQQANAFDAQSEQQADVINQGQAQQAAQFGVGATMDAERANESLRQQGLGNYINALGNLAQMEDKYTLDPFQALLGRGGGGSLQAGQGVFGQAGYGLDSGPQYLNPEAGLGYISQQNANQANMYAANVAADASRSSGIMGGIGALGGGLLSNASLFCWVAREVYGPTNPSWLQFREWMFTESPNWFFKLYAEYGERFANWISNKPRLKSIIRKWMDSKIGDK